MPLGVGVIDSFIQSARRFIGPAYRLSRDEITELRRPIIHNYNLAKLKCLGEARQRAVDLESTYFEDLGFSAILEELQRVPGRERDLGHKLQSDGIQSYVAAVDSCKEENDVNALILAASKAAIRQLTNSWDDKGFNYQRVTSSNYVTVNLDDMGYEKAIAIALEDIEIFSRWVAKQSNHILRNLASA